MSRKEKAEMEGHYVMKPFRLVGKKNFKVIFPDKDRRNELGFRSN